MLRQMLEEMMKNARVVEQPPPKDGIYCEECNSTGYVQIEDGLYTELAPCKKCHHLRNVKEQMEKALGNYEHYKSYTLESFKCNNKERQDMKYTAIKFIKEYNGSNWLCALGQSGSGKTHLCIAVAMRLVEEKGIDFEYFDYRAEMPQLKRDLNMDVESYKRKMNRLKKVKLLYIDDLFKSMKTENGEADKRDLQVIFELINARYLARRATIVSSEYSMSQLIKIDEAIGGRINEMIGYGRYVIKANCGNWRIKGE